MVVHKIPQELLTSRAIHKLNYNHEVAPSAPATTPNPRRDNDGGNTTTTTASIITLITKDNGNSKVYSMDKHTRRLHPVK